MKRKKVLIIILAVLMALSFYGCTKNKDVEDTTEVILTAEEAKTAFFEAYQGIKAENNYKCVCTFNYNSGDEKQNGICEYASSGELTNTAKRLEIELTDFDDVIVTNNYEKLKHHVYLSKGNDNEYYMFQGYESRCYEDGIEILGEYDKEYIYSILEIEDFMSYLSTLSNDYFFYGSDISELDDMIDNVATQFEGTSKSNIFTIKMANIYNYTSDSDNMVCKTQITFIIENDKLKSYSYIEEYFKNNQYFGKSNGDAVIEYNISPIMLPSINNYEFEE